MAQKTSFLETLDKIIMLTCNLIVLKNRINSDIMVGNANQIINNKTVPAALVHNLCVPFGTRVLRGSFFLCFTSLHYDSCLSLVQKKMHVELHN